MIHTLTIPTPPAFNFWRTVYSHGWCALLPFKIDKEEQTFQRLLVLRNGSMVNCTMLDSSGVLKAKVEISSRLTTDQRQDILGQIRACLRLDEDFSEFHDEARRHKEFRWVPKIGAGRMLRAPTVFEDVVKMICTTNCSWALTETMVNNLNSHLGRHFDGAVYSFPTPEAIAGSSETYLRKNIRAGYRSPYLLQLAEYVAGGKLDIESWRSSPPTTEELFKQARSVKGMGDYAAGNILKLLGRYDYLGLDSWVRSKFCEIHKRGRRVTDKTIERHYAEYGKWRGLFFWLDMTKDWYQEKFPF